MVWRRRSDDIEARARRALDLHDDVVQQLATAKLALELDRHEDALAAVTRGLEQAKALTNELLVDGATGPGDLRRP